MSAIHFDPALPSARSAALKAGHLGRAVKVWARIAGVPVGVLATGGHSGIEWMFSERCTDDEVAFVVGFGVAANGWEPEIPRDIAHAVERLFPEGRLLDCDWHDWNADPDARGTWVSARVDLPTAFAAPNWSPLGRLAFASSDVASTDAGWFEGAIVSGQQAAAEIQDALKAP